MSIASEISRISGNVSDALDAIEDKGVTIPAGANSDDLADLIAQISGGGGAAITVSDTTDTHGGIIRTITGVDLSQDTVTAAHLEQGYTAHDAQGNPVTGTLSPGGGGQYAWLGEDAEKVGTVLNRVINLKDDTDYDNWTASTTATVIVPADTDPSLSYLADLSNYDYAFVTRGYIEPVYQSGTPVTYRTYRVCQYHIQYYFGTPLGSNIEQVQGDLAGNVSYSGTTSNGYQYYYNNAGILQARTATQCGPLYMSTYPTYNYTTISDGKTTISLRFPAFSAKCDTNRFTTERKGQVDSANTNYLLTVDLYRVPHGKGLMSYWISQMCADLNAV